MRDSKTFFTAFIVTLLILTGCSKTDSENIRTTGIEANIAVEANGDGKTSISATLQIGSGGVGATDIILRNGDQLVATAYGSTQAFQRESYFGIRSYRTTFNNDVGDETFQVSLDRVDGFSAPDSTVVLPLDFEFVTPADNTLVSVDTPIGVSWQPANPTATIERTIRTSCTINRHEVVVDNIGESSVVTYTEFSKRFFAEPLLIDDGAFTIDDPTSILPILLPNEAFVTESACALTITLNRVRNGELDQHYGSGYIEAKQQRELKLSINIQSLATP